VASIGAAIAEGGTSWSDEYRFRRADGSYAVVRDRAHIVRDEAGRSLRVISAISGLSNAHAADRHLQQVLDALQVGVSVVDKEGRIVVANTSEKQLWGGHKAWWADTGEPLRPDEWGAARAIQGEFSADEELIVETPEGEQKTIRKSAAPIIDDSGEIIGAVSVSEDVTRAKVVEAARIRQEEENRREKMEAIGRLAGGIAHDFNNLLTGILSYSDLIMQELRPADPMRADVEQIRDAGQRAASLTRQLLAFSRRQVLQPRVLSLNTTVRELEAMLGRLAGPNISLETVLAADLGNALADAASLEQVLVNLVINAREAMPEGGQIRITTANSPPSELSPQGYVSLWVSDTGIGMDPATQSHIFEPFFTTKRGTSGTGLGLSTVYGIVEQSGGKITVESAPGQGSSFGIHFPRHVGADEPGPSPDEPVAQGGKETLLLVDDEPAVRDSVRRLLERHGYTVIEARDAADALRLYDRHGPGIDLVLTDVTMPGMGGYELVEQLRARRPDLRVLFMSGYAERAMVNNGATGSGTGFVEKPFNVKTLMQRVREVLEG
jgi:signal transduction histidine kinase/CheY-like chemotaxis protein